MKITELYTKLTGLTAYSLWFRLHTDVGTWRHLSATDIENDSKELCEKIAEFEVDTVPFSGPIWPELVDDAEIYRRAGLRITIAVNQEIRHKVLPNYFTEIYPRPGLEGHDICGYCCHSNGPGGLCRDGFDCCYCGGN